MPTLFDVPSVSQEWMEWRRRVAAILGLELGLELGIGSEVPAVEDLPRPWYLLPRQQGEMGAGEAEGLFHAVRQSLWGGSTPSLHLTRQSLQRMSAWDSLPLLYAMRHVAHHLGGGAYFWPPFHQQVLDDKLPADCYSALAPVFADLWVRLYQASEGALYRPNSRLAYIKWPLAHAGLLPDDVEALRGFGISLHQRHSGEVSAAPLRAEAQEQFRLYFLDWFFSRRRASHPRLATLLDKQDGTEAVITEFAQRWLLEHWGTLEVAEGGGHDAKALCLPGRSLRYDVAQNRLLLVFGEGTWAGNAVGRLAWGKHSPVLQKSYCRDLNRSSSAPFTLTVAPEDWSSEATWEVGGECFPLRLPQPPSRSQGAVFRTDTGKAISGWQTGDKYYALVAREWFRQEDAGTLFEHRADLGSPEGGWDDFVLLWVQTMDLLPSGKPSDLSKKDVFEVMDWMEAATERMRLPSLVHSFRPRLSLVGGTRLQGGAEAVYDIGDPIPWLAVRGAYRTLAVTLSRWEEGQGGGGAERWSHYAPVSECALCGAPDLSGQMVSLWENGESVAEGLYRVEAGPAEALFFRLRRAPARPSEAFATLKLRISVVPDQEQAGPQNMGGRVSPDQCCGVTRQEMATGRLVVTGWPFADVVLRVTLGMTEKRHPVRLGADGRWEAPWRSLGVRLDQPGSVRVWVLWRGVMSAEMTVADTPYVADGGFTFSHAAGGALTVSGTLSNVGTAMAARISVLRRRFWNGQITTITTRPAILSSDGRFRETFPEDAGKGCWVVVVGRSVVNGRSEEQLWHQDSPQGCVSFCTRVKLSGGKRQQWMTHQ